LNAGAPNNRRIVGGRLRFDTEEETEKILMGFDSEESFTKMDKNGNVADRVRVEMMKLKPVEIKEATEERRSGEGQSPFGKVVKCDDFVNIFHMKTMVKSRMPVTRV
jgi:hypothetical protein